LSLWTARNAQASSILWNSLTSTQQTGIESVVGNAAEMWTMLLNTYHRTTMVEKAYLFLDFLMFRWKPGHTMRQFTTEYQGLVGRLHAAGMKVEDFMIPLRLMLALPDEYSYERKRALDNPDGLTLDELCGRLLTEESVLKRNRGDRRPGAANPAYGREGAKGGSSSTLPKKCYRCGGDHLWKECKLPEGVRKCFTCGGVDHLQRDCPKKSSGSGGQK